jgi:thymidylate kinase
MQNQKKLIVLRGNSGSGKSTIAKKFRDLYPDLKIALIEQDYIRRNILREKGGLEGAHINLIKENVEYCLENDFHVILEGIFHLKLYKDLLNYLNQKFPNNIFFYFDISLDETLRRSKTKNDFHEYGEEKVRSWYIEKDYTNFANEYTINEDLTEEKIIEFMKAKINLI